MPIIVPADELQPGMRLAEPLVSQERVLLSASKELTQLDIDGLLRRFPGLRLCVADPILDSLAEFEDDSLERDVANTVRTEIADAMVEVQERYAARASLRNIGVSRAQAAVFRVVEYLKNNPVTAAMLSRTVGEENYLARHTGNVFYLSMLLGSAVSDYVAKERIRQTRAKGLDRRAMLDLTSLGLGAMFMDLGMLPLQYLYRKEEPMTPEEGEELRGHPQAGVDMLPDNISPLAKLIVRTHHENVDGTGYPKGLVGNDVHIFTRIVRIADAFDSATSSHVYEDAKSPVRALWEMTNGPYRAYYDPVLIRVFGRLIQPFPIGAKLRLADGRYAVVVRYNRKDPFRPHVLIAFDRDNRRLPADRIDGPFGLASRANVRLAWCGDEDISYIHESRVARDNLQPGRTLATMLQASYP